MRAIFLYATAPRDSSQALVSPRLCAWLKAAEAELYALAGRPDDCRRALDAATSALPHGTEDRDADLRGGSSMERTSAGGAATPSRCSATNEPSRSFTQRWPRSTTRSSGRRRASAATWRRRTSSATNRTTRAPSYGKRGSLRTDGVRATSAEDRAPHGKAVARGLPNARTCKSATSVTDPTSSPCAIRSRTSASGTHSTRPASSTSVGSPTYVAPRPTKIS